MERRTDLSVWVDPDVSYRGEKVVEALPFQCQT